MKNVFAIMALLIFGLTGCAVRTAEKPTVILPVDGDLQVEFTLPGERWEFSRQAPAFLVDQIVDHLREETAASGVQLNETQLQQLARKRLAVNEAFVANPGTGAYLMIDFSRLPEGAPSPEKDEIWGSAYGAELALKNENGVSDVSSKIRSVRLAGSRFAYRTDIRYRLHGEPRRFVGIVGCTTAYRFYFYYNDLLRDPLDFELMERTLRSLRLHGDNHS
jgi:hypothetical protein